MLNSVDMNFWGVQTKVYVSPIDMKHLEFFFGSFICDTTDDAQVSVELHSSSPRGSFFESSLAKDNELKKIIFTDHIQPENSHSYEFTDWSGHPSPLPPIMSAGLKSRIALRSGGVVRLHGLNIAITGENYVGKTSTIIELVKKFNADLISDSVIIIDISSGLVLPWPSPLGFRRDNLLKVIPDLNYLDHRLTVSPDTGIVALVNPQDYFNKPNAAGGKIDLILNLCHSNNNQHVTSTEISTVESDWFSAVDVIFGASIPDTTKEIHFPKSYNPELRARHISDIVLSLSETNKYAESNTSK